MKISGIWLWGHERVMKRHPWLGVVPVDDPRGLSRWVRWLSRWVNVGSYVYPLEVGFGRALVTSGRRGLTFCFGRYGCSVNRKGEWVWSFWIRSRYANDPRKYYYDYGIGTAHLDKFYPYKYHPFLSWIPRIETQGTNRKRLSLIAGRGNSHG